MIPRTFRPGFRLSALDVAVLIAGGTAAYALSLWQFWIGIAAAFVVMHFFLFCNVLRMSRPLELIWASVFVALALGAIAELLMWPVVLGLACAMTLVLAALEMRRSSYHGILWQIVNPKLPEWWQSQNHQA